MLKGCIMQQLAHAIYHVQTHMQSTVLLIHSGIKVGSNKLMNYKNFLIKCFVKNNIFLKK